MKACPTCGRLYPPDAGYCPVDGAALGRATQVPVVVDSDDPRVGSLIKERYQIRRIVADGGMGRVYEALDLVDRRNVAVKILHGHVARDPVQVERFKREFEVSQQLPHDHIVEVIEFAKLGDGSYVLVMEFLFGEELAQALKRERYLSPERIVRMLSQVAIGLDKAHAIHLVHRDLKPDNVFLCQTPDGDNVKLLDFGSVKDKAEGAKKLTVMGTTIGSPFYMAPEQAQGLDTLDHRADVWALGAIVFECMSGNVPFPGVNGPQILLNILTKDAPRVSAAEAPKYPIPPTLDRVLEKTFKKTASLRYESVGALADALGHAYGLEGSHHEWAEMPEPDLKRAIGERIFELLSSQPVEVKSTPQDSFFGDSDSLGEGEAAAFPATKITQGSAAERAVRPYRSQDFEDDGAPLTIPVQSSGIPMWVFVAVGLGFLAIVALFVL